MEQKEIYIKVTKDGPYLVYGLKKISEKIILTDKNGVCCGYTDGKVFESASEPAVLCRCGQSKNAPFCDGTHADINFNGTETATFEPASNTSMTFGGADFILSDNTELCAFARFCDAKGTIWNLIRSGEKEDDEMAIKEAELCPSGRLVILDKEGNPIEKEYEKTISLLEDSGLKISGPIWLRGGIRIESEDGKSYEIRNRQTLCRCGNSGNKPFCNGEHAKSKFKAEYKNTENF